MRKLIALLALTTGCWNGSSSTLDFSDTSFAPTAGAVPGWSVRAEPMVGLACPDGTEPSFLTVYPEGASGPQPVAVVLHSGAFDFVREPDVADPLAGDHYAEASRFDSSFSTTKMYATLGMYPDPDLVESSTGALPLALANRGVTMILPSNCWGDMWHNSADGNSNDVVADGFVRSGRDAAAWAWAYVSESGFPTANRLTPAVEIDRSSLYLVGLGTGGRGVSELLVEGASPAAAMMDATADDLGTYFDDEALYADEITGISRLFPDGAASVSAGALHDAGTPLPPRLGYVYSSVDATIPVASHDLAIARLEAETTATTWVYDALGTAHVTTAADSLAAEQAADFLVGN